MYAARFKYFSCSGCLRLGCLHRDRHTTHVAARRARLRFHLAKHSACTAFRHVLHVRIAPCCCAGAAISSRHTGQVASSSDLPDEAASCWPTSVALLLVAVAGRADQSWWNLSLARAPASTSGHDVGVATRRATWQGRSNCLHTQASSRERPRTRRRTKRTCLHGAAGSGHVHAGDVDSVTVYTFPVAPSTKNSAPARCSSRSWARMMRFATRRVDSSSAAVAAAAAAKGVVVFDIATG
nr:unnamed protein product [Digitaria exilis]